MLDATTFAQAATVYRATDPAQVIYRSLLSSYSDAQLTRVEDEIGTFSRTGLLPTGIQALLDVAGAH